MERAGGIFSPPLFRERCISSVKIVAVGGKRSPNIQYLLAVMSLDGLQVLASLAGGGGGTK